MFLDEDRGYGLRDFDEALSRWMPGHRSRGCSSAIPAAEMTATGRMPGCGSRLHRWWSRQLPRPGAGRARRRSGRGRPPDGERRLFGIKPYRLYAELENTNEATIESFAPEWMWRLCHDRDGVLMLHIMAPAASPMRTMSKHSLPLPPLSALPAGAGACGACLQLPPCTRGLQAIADLENVIVDTAAVTHPAPSAPRWKYSGPRRVLWGSDYMVSQLRGACFTQGDGFTWVYADDASAKDLTVFGSYTMVGIESLLCLARPAKTPA